MTNPMIHTLHPIRGWQSIPASARQTAARLWRQLRNRAADAARILQQSLQPDTMPLDAQDLDFRHGVLRHEARRLL